MSDKSGMTNIDPNRPVVENGQVQLRLVTLMSHPDYSLDKAFNGKGAIKANRNEELDQMSLIDLLNDAKRRIEEEIAIGSRWAQDYGYAGFMTDAWKRALQQGLVNDPYYNEIDYIEDDLFRRGVIALMLRKHRYDNR